MSTVPEAVPPEVESHRKPPFLRRVRIRNFKSIKFCDVTLEPLTVLVGRNGSGKSNFVEALAFLRDVVTWGTEKAVTLHGGPTVSFRMDQEPVEIEVEYEGYVDNGTELTREATLRYSVELVGVRRRPRVHAERFTDITPGREDGISESDSGRDEGDPDTLRPQLIGLYEAGGLTSIQEYAFDLRELRRPQASDTSSVLAPDGANLASIFHRIQLLNDNGWTRDRIQQYLSIIVGEVRSVEAVRVADFDALKFHLSNGETPFSLYAASMSDGTLRVLATLVAAFQTDSFFGAPSLVAVEEPETSLHPAAMHALVDALDEATGRTQILLTTHSAELLDNPTIRPENVRVVEMVNGETVITPVDDASVEIVKRGLNTLGGLERDDLLQLNFKALREREAQLEKPQ